MRVQSWSSGKNSPGSRRLIIASAGSRPWGASAAPLGSDKPRAEHESRRSLGFGNREDVIGHVQTGSVKPKPVPWTGATPATEVQAPVGQPCPERRVLVVRNNTGGEVEIVESRTGSGARTVIAYVRAGVQEIPIRNDYEYAYSARAVGGRTTMATTNRTRVRDRTVELIRECREGGTPKRQETG